MARETILTKTAFDFADSGEGVYLCECELSTSLENEQTYYVIWDDVEYSCVASVSEDITTLGNLAISNLCEDTREPFLISLTSEGATIATIATTDTATSHTVNIYRNKIENVIIKNPLGKSVTYGEYDNVCLTNSNGTKTYYSKLPEVTEDDNEKVLGVVDGVWQKMKARSVSSWNDLTDRPFGEENGLVDILPLRQLDNFSLDPTYGIYCISFTESVLGTDLLTVGETYNVFWDGIEYECVAQDISALITNAVAIGNGSAFGFIGNNEPFIIMRQMLTNNQIMLVFASLTDTEAGGSHTVRVTQDGIIIETIDTKYLPKHLQIGEETVNVSLIDGSYKWVYVDDVWDIDAPIPVTSDMHLTEGEIYTVTWNGVEYKCKCFMFQGTIPAVGNTVISGGDDNGMPFLIVEDATGAIAGTPLFMFAPIEDPDPTVTTEVIYDIKLTYSGTIIKCLDNKLLEFMDVQEYKEIMSPHVLIFTLDGENTENPEESIFICNGTSLFNVLNKMSCGNKYEITWNDTKYICTAQELVPESVPEGIVINKYLFCGNKSLASETDANTGEPFLICVTDISANGQTQQSVGIITKHNSTDSPFDCVVSIVQLASATVKKECLPGVLPEVTTSDNDKVMTVVNGVWVAQTPASGLPEVTTSDAGKFLRVDSSGAWVAETIPSAEGASF